MAFETTTNKEQAEVTSVGKEETDIVASAETQELQEIGQEQLQQNDVLLKQGLLASEQALFDADPANNAAAVSFLATQVSLIQQTDQKTSVRGGASKQFVQQESSLYGYRTQAVENKISDLKEQGMSDEQINKQMEGEIGVKKVVSLAESYGVANHSIFDASHFKDFFDTKFESKQVDGEKEKGNHEEFSRGVAESYRSKMTGLSNFLTTLTGNLKVVKTDDQLAALGFSTTENYNAAVQKVSVFANTMKTYIDSCTDAKGVVDIQLLLTNVPSPPDGQTLAIMKHFASKTGDTSNSGVDSLFTLGNDFTGNDKIIIYDIVEKSVSTLPDIKNVADLFADNKADIAPGLGLGDEFFAKLDNLPKGSKVSFTIDSGVSSARSYAGWSDAQVNSEHNRRKEEAIAVYGNAATAEKLFTLIHTTIMNQEGLDKERYTPDQILRESKLLFARTISLASHIKEHGNPDVSLSFVPGTFSIGKSGDTQAMKADRFTKAQTKVILPST